MRGSTVELDVENEAINVEVWALNVAWKMRSFSFFLIPLIWTRKGLVSAPPPRCKLGESESFQSYRKESNSKALIEGSLLHSIIFTSDINAYERTTSLHQYFAFKPLLYKISARLFCVALTVAWEGRRRRTNGCWKPLANNRLWTFPLFELWAFPLFPGVSPVSSHTLRSIEPMA